MPRSAGRMAVGRSVGGRGGRRRPRRAAGDEDRVVGVGEPHGARAGLLDRRALDHLVAAESPRPRGQLGGRQAARRRRGAREDDVELVGAQRRQHLAGSRPRRQPTTRIRRPAGSKSSKNTVAHTSAPAGLWAPSMMTSGWWPSTSNRPGIVDVGEALAHARRRRTGAAKNVSTAVERDAPRCRPGGGRAAARTRRGRSWSACAGRAAARRARAGSRRTSKSLAAHERAWRRRRRRKISTSSGSVSPITTALPGLMMPGLLAGDVGLGRAGELGVVDRRCW